MKVVAIGGGIHYKNDAGIWTCSFLPILKRIIELSNKNSPNALILCHASNNYENECIQAAILSEIFESLNCNTKILLCRDLTIKSMCEELVDWADIIYESGGNSIKMLNAWNISDFSSILMSSSKNKILSGLSAGANCWFSYFSTRQKGKGVLIGKGLGLIDAYFTPHANEKDRQIKASLHIKELNKIGILIPDDIGIEIVDSKYRIVNGLVDDFYLAEYYDDTNAVFKYYEADDLITKKMKNTQKYKSLTKLLKR